jgi:hypothetical protein
MAEFNKQIQKYDNIDKKYLELNDLQQKYEEMEGKIGELNWGALSYFIANPDKDELKYYTGLLIGDIIKSENIINKLKKNIQQVPGVKLEEKRIKNFINKISEIHQTLVCVEEDEDGKKRQEIAGVIADNLLSKYPTVIYNPLNESFDEVLLKNKLKENNEYIKIEKDKIKAITDKWNKKINEILSSRGEGYADFVKKYKNYKVVIEHYKKDDYISFIEGISDPHPHMIEFVKDNKKYKGYEFLDFILKIYSVEYYDKNLKEIEEIDKKFRSEAEKDEFKEYVVNTDDDDYYNVDEMKIKEKLEKKFTETVKNQIKFVLAWRNFLGVIQENIYKAIGKELNRQEPRWKRERNKWKTMLDGINKQLEDLNELHNALEDSLGMKEQISDMDNN